MKERLALTALHAVHDLEGVDRSGRVADFTHEPSCTTQVALSGDVDANLSDSVHRKYSWEVYILKVFTVSGRCQVPSLQCE